MLMWILTASVIAVLAAGALELFRESEPPCPPGSHPGSWQTMSESDLDGLVAEFSNGESPRPENVRPLTA